MPLPEADPRRSDMRIFVTISALLFGVGLVSGYAFPSRFRGTLTPSLRKLVELVDKTHGAHSWLYTFANIFFHNVWAALSLIVLGFLFGLFPALNMWTNGLLVGFVIALTAEQRGVPAWKMLLFGIAPHGIFELPALVWAGALGLANGFAVVRTVIAWFQRDSERDPAEPMEAARGAVPPLKPALRRSLRTLPYIVGMLLVAALIESSITPVLLQWAIHPAA